MKQGWISVSVWILFVNITPPQAFTVVKVWWVGKKCKGALNMCETQVGDDLETVPHTCSYWSPQLDYYGCDTHSGYVKIHCTYNFFFYSCTVGYIKPLAMLFLLICKLTNYYFPLNLRKIIGVHILSPEVGLPRRKLKSFQSRSLW